MRSIVMTLPVRNLKVSMAFFRELGFAFIPEQSGADTACMVIDSNVRVMLTDRQRSRDRVSVRAIQADSAGEVLTRMSAGSEQEVDDTVARAIAIGAQPWPLAQDGPGYSGSFQDLDGHVWQLSYQPAPAAGRETLSVPA